MPVATSTRRASIGAGATHPADRAGRDRRRKDSRRSRDYRSLARKTPRDERTDGEAGGRRGHALHPFEGTTMKISFRQFALASTLLATAAFPLLSHAQDVRREDRVTHYLESEIIDANKDGMVSKKEFMDAMSKSWDMHMGEAKKMAPDAKAPKDKMTLQQYLEFSKMFGLNIGS